MKKVPPREEQGSRVHGNGSADRAASALTLTQLMELDIQLDGVACVLGGEEAVAAMMKYQGAKQRFNSILEGVLGGHFDSAAFETALEALSASGLKVWELLKSGNLRLLDTVPGGHP